MTRAARSNRATRTKVTAKARRPKPGHGNPAWQKAFVTASRRQNFEPDEFVKKSPISLSAAPSGSLDGSHDTNSVKVTVAQNGYTAPFTLEIEATSAPRGRKIFWQDVTLAQLYSFEEAVRAVFIAAREEGILPAA